jgi:uncharacterized oligopeptide transporter (OPT) family protein
MATLIKGIQGGKLDWNFVLAGAFLALVMELCGVRALSFAIGVYLPISTTLPIYIGGVIRSFADKVKKRKGLATKEGEEELERGNLFATGLVAGGALMGVIFAFLNIPDKVVAFLKKLSLEGAMTSALGQNGYYLVGIVFFAIMGYVLYRTAIAKEESV